MSGERSVGARRFLTVTATAGLMLGGALAATSLAQDAASPSGPASASRSQPLPDLVGLLESASGCLGIERARTQSGKYVVFAWFADKQAVLSWYTSATSQSLLDQFFSERDVDFAPLADVPDDTGPIMAVVSLTLAGQSQFEQTSLPVSQIAVELFTPITAGLHLGGRLSPAGFSALKAPQETETPQETMTPQEETMTPQETPPANDG